MYHADYAYLSMLLGGHVRDGRSDETSYERIDKLFEIVWEHISELKTKW